MSRHRHYWLSVIVLGVGLAVSTYVFYFTDSPTSHKDKTHTQVSVKKIPVEQVLFLHPGQQVVFRLTRPAPPKVEIQKGVVVYAWRTDFGEITFADDREIHYTAPKQSGVADLIEYRLPREQPIFSLMVMTRGNHQVQKMEEKARRASSQSSKEYGVGTAQFRLRIVLDSAAK